MANVRIFLLVSLIGVLAVATVLLMGRYFREMKAARAALDSLGSRVIETDCGVIEYVRLGEGHPVLVVHGTMGGFDQGLLVARPIIAAGFQVISVSRFGYLGSPLPAGADVNRQADLYACLLDELGIDRAAVFTFSGGATSAIRLAARHPGRVSGLILLAPAAPGPVQVPAPPKAVFDTLMRSDFVFWAMITYNRAFGYQMLGAPKGFPLTPADKAELDESLATTLPIGRRIDGFLFDNYDLQFGKDFLESITDNSPYPLAEVKTPILAIGAEDDPYSNIQNVRILVSKFPNAHLFTVPDGGHPHLGHAAEVDSEIVRFLDNLATAEEQRLNFISLSNERR